MKPILFPMLVLLSLCGCVPDPVIQYKERTVLITPPDALIVDCVLIAPPDKKIYLNSTDDEKEDLLTDALMEQYAAVTLCNKNLGVLRKWKADEIKQRSGDK